MGLFDSNQYSIPNSPFSTGGSTTGGSTTGGGAKVDWTGLGLSVLNTGGNIFASSQQNQSAQAQANALIAQGKSQVEVARIMQEIELAKLEASKNAVAGGKSGSTVLYVAVGVGAVLILGVVIFAVTRKKA